MKTLYLLMLGVAGFITGCSTTGDLTNTTVPPSQLTVKVHFGEFGDVRLDGPARIYADGQLITDCWPPADVLLPLPPGKRCIRVEVEEALQFFTNASPRRIRLSGQDDVTLLPGASTQVLDFGDHNLKLVRKP